MKHYEVRYVILEDGKRWNSDEVIKVKKNCEAHVATTSVERALELVRAAHPDAVFDSVHCRNSHVDLIVDNEQEV